MTRTDTSAVNEEGLFGKRLGGFKKVIIPAKNYKHSSDPRDYYIEVLPAENLDDYLKECLV
jgi:predicted ATP-dependent protease